MDGFTVQSSSIPLREAIRLSGEWLYKEWSMFTGFMDDNALLSWNEYHSLSYVIWSDLCASIVAVNKWCYWTLKPAGNILFWVLYRLLHYGYLFIQKMLPSVFDAFKIMLQYAKTGANMFLQFEKDLTRLQHFYQASVMIGIVLIYLIHKWFQRTLLFKQINQYMTDKKQRIKKFFTTKFLLIDNSVQRKKRKVKRAYRKVVKYISEVSTLLAMATPHILFLSIVLSIKLFLPSLITWLANDTYATSLLSWWYPLIHTLIVLNQTRGGGKSNGNDTKSGSSKKQTGKTTKVMASPLAKKQSESLSSSKTNSNRTTTTTNASKTLYPRMTRAVRLRNEEKSRKLSQIEEKTKLFEEKTAKFSSYRRGASTATSNKMKASSADKKPQFSFTIEEPIEFLLHYWNLFSSIQLLKGLMKATPIVSRLPFLPQSWVAQIELVFFTWVLLIDYNWLVQPTEDYSKESWHFLLTHRPPIGFANILKHFYLPLYESASNAISKKFWNDKVVERVRSPLEALVFIRFVSKPMKDRILYMLTHMQPFILPSMGLGMPSFVTQFAVLYAQYVIPNAQHHISPEVEATEKNKNVKENKIESEVIASLQYWVIHMLVSVSLNYWSPIIWWIPFSTHVIYLLWVYLSLPSTVTTIYGEITRELQMFGLLPKNDNEKNGEEGKDHDISSSNIEHESRTLKILQAVVKLLPSAQKDDNNPIDTLALGASKSDDDDITTATAGDDSSIGISNTASTNPENSTSSNSSVAIQVGNQTKTGTDSGDDVIKSDAITTKLKPTGLAEGGGGGKSSNAKEISSSQQRSNSMSPVEGKDGIDNNITEGLKLRINSTTNPNKNVVSDDEGVILTSDEKANLSSEEEKKFK